MAGLSDRGLWLGFAQTRKQRVGVRAAQRTGPARSEVSTRLCEAQQAQALS